MTGTPQHRGGQGDADLTITLTVIDGHKTVCADCCPTCNEETS